MEKHLHRMWLHLVHRFVPFSLNRCVSENSPFNMQMTRIIVDALTFNAFFSLKWTKWGPLKKMGTFWGPKT